MHDHRDTRLTGASLRNGRIYFSASDVPFFGPIRFGGRDADDLGTPVEIEVHGAVITTDVRRSSGQRLSPRKSFAQWFRAIRAEEGAILRLTSTGERKFRLDYVDGDRVHANRAEP